MVIFTMFQNSAERDRLRSRPPRTNNDWKQPWHEHRKELPDQCLMQGQLPTSAVQPGGRRKLRQPAAKPAIGQIKHKTNPLHLCPAET